VNTVMTTNTTTGLRPPPERGSVSGWRISLVLICGTMAGVLILLTCLTDLARKSDQPDLVPAIWQDEVAGLRAEQQFDKGLWAEAQSSARRSVTARGGGDVSALRVLALVAENRGMVGQASRLMVVGSRWSWRDSETQYWLFRNQLQARQYASAIVHGEALAARGQFTDQIYREFAKLSADRGARPWLIRALRRGESWRDGFFGSLKNSPEQLHPALSSLMRQMRQNGLQPNPEDAVPLLQAMLESGEPAAARALWRDLFWRRGEALPTIVDGGFEQTPPQAVQTAKRGMFEWQFDPGAGIYITSDPRGRPGAVLQVEAAGNGHGPLARQQLVLDPGRWELSFAIRSGKADIPSRLQVGLRCGTRGPWLTPPLPQGSATTWRTFNLGAVIGEDCKTQSLVIEPIGTQAGESMDVWLDDFDLRRPDRVALRLDFEPRWRIRSWAGDASNALKNPSKAAWEIVRRG